MGVIDAILEDDKQRPVKQLCLAKIASGRKQVSRTKLRDLIWIEPLAGKHPNSDAEDRQMQC